MKRTIVVRTVMAFLFVIVVAGVALIPFKTAKAADGVEINETNFPDPVFRQYVLDNFSDGSGKLVQPKSYKKVEIANKGIKDLKGIEFFDAVERIDCSSNKLTKLDVSGCKELKWLYCNDNQLTELNTGNLENLVTVKCFSNKFASLDLSGCKNIKLFDCHSNPVSKLDLSGFERLEELYCYDCQLKDLDIGSNLKIKYVSCYDNQLTELDLKNNTMLTNLSCYGNQITTLDIENCANLIDCFKNFRKMEDKGSYVRYQLTTTVNEYSTFLAVDKTTNVITEPVSVSVKLDKTTADVVCGKTLDLKATVEGSDDAATWTSSDESVATVDSKGTVTAKAAGSVTITASVSGVKAECVVQVLFKDVTSAKDFWYAPTYYLANSGVVKGYDKQTNFKPANVCTRAQMVTFIWRLKGEPEPQTKTCKFSDVKEKDYFYKACIWGNENHIVEGYKDGTFGPQIVCARKHAVTFLWRLAGKPDPATKTNKFKDVKEKDYFYKATLWASEKGILAGYKDGTFKPEGDCLRRQMVTFLYKYDKFINVKG